MVGISTLRILSGEKDKLCVWNDTWHGVIGLRAHKEGKKKWEHRKSKKTGTVAGRKIR